MSPEAMLEERVQIIVTEVKAGRVKGERADVEAFVSEAFTLPADERRSLVMVALKEINGFAKPKETKVEKPPAVNGVLGGNELVMVGAALFREQPDLSAPDAYQSLLARGYKVAQSQLSWQSGGTARRARALSKTDTTLPRLRPLEREVAASPPKPRPGPKPRTPAPARVTREVTQRPRADVARRPPVAPPVEVGASSPNGIREGDHILLELAGRRFDAVKKPGGWLVDFDGEIPDELVETIMGKMLGKVGA